MRHSSPHKRRIGLFAERSLAGEKEGPCPPKQLTDKIANPHNGGPTAAKEP